MSTETVLSDTMQVVTFTIAEKDAKKGNYAVPIEQVKEIRTVDAITEIPKSKSYVKGIMNLRGKIIPIIDVNDKIGLSSINTDNSKQRILVADVNDTLTGLLVDEVNEVMRFSMNDIESPPPGAFEENSYIKGIVNTEENLIVLLDVSKFLKESEGISEEQIESAKQEEIVEDKVESSENDQEILPEIDKIIQETSN